MSVIKLDAIDSTNDFLKQLAKEKEIENFTLVMANKQSNGRGQMGAKWISEPGKNLIMSVLVKNISLEMVSIFDFNVVVAVAAMHTLKELNVPDLKLKWPNDIMADSKKVGGILIENVFKLNQTFTSVVGFGLNLNQKKFDNLPQASSLACIMNKSFEIDKVALLFVENLKQQLNLIPDSIGDIWKEYDSMLFKKNKPVAFESLKGIRFMGIIKKVTRDGKLEVLLDDDTVVHFEVKEVKMLY